MAEIIRFSDVLMHMPTEMSKSLVWDYIEKFPDVLTPFIINKYIESHREILYIHKYTILNTFTTKDDIEHLSNYIKKYVKT